MISTNTNTENSVLGKLSSRRVVIDVHRERNVLNKVQIYGENKNDLKRKHLFFMGHCSIHIYFMKLI